MGLLRNILQMKRDRSTFPTFYIPHEDFRSRLFCLLRDIGLNDLARISNTKNADHKSFILPVQIHKLCLMDRPDKLFSKKILNEIQSSNMELLFDLSTEAVICEGYNERNLLAFQDWLKKNNIDNNRVTLINSNPMSQENYNKWADKKKIDYRIRVLGYNFYLFEYYWEVKRNEWFRANKNNLIKSAHETLTQNKLRNKHFMCLNLRPRAHRTAITLHLLERNFLDKGIITYFGQDFGNNEVPGVEPIEEAIDFIKSLPSGNRLLSKTETLDKLTPITYERDAKQVRKDLWERSPGEVDFIIPEAKKQKTINNIETYFEIVNETWFSGSRNVYITEKTVRPILRFQPFIHVGCPGTLNHLREKGFKTFSPIINEAYDNIINPQERMEAIFVEIDRLCSLPLENLHNLYCDLWPVLEHNFYHFTENMPKLCKEEIKNNILNKIKQSLKTKK